MSNSSCPNRLAFQMSFVQQSQEACLHSEVFRALTLTYGQNLVESLIFCIGGGSPRTSLPYLSELLHTITTRFPQESRTWLKECMAKVSVHNVHRLIPVVIGHNSRGLRYHCRTAFQARGPPRPPKTNFRRLLWRKLKIHSSSWHLIS